jgi:hypothetical protein
MGANSSSWKKKRPQERYEQIPYKYYIFCEGEKTEPQYFEAFKQCIESNPIYKNLILVEIKGLGMETMRIIKFAEDYVRKNLIANAQVWCVYDKDSFPAVDFNGVEQRTRELNKKQENLIYGAAWSNQCIEYWFILHFDYYDSDNDRQSYIGYLTAKFIDLGLKGYKKNDANIFNILLEYGNPKFALKNAARRLSECAEKTPSASAPATTINYLVTELAKFLPEDVKNKFIE